MRPSLRIFALVVTLSVLFVGAPVQPVEAAWSGRFSVYRQAAFVSQVTDYSCVGASIQMMLNIIRGESDKSGTRQRTYLRYARSHSRYTIRNGGADPRGWALALRHWGAGYYSVGRKWSMQASLKEAAKRMRATRKPVGMLVLRGGHAWVMTGFASNRDPARTNDFRVTKVQVMGPLWPDGTVNGRPYDPKPGSWLGLDALRAKFRPYYWKPATNWNGRYITVIP